MEHFFSTGKFPTGKQDNLFKIPLIPGNFLVERPENVCSINIPTEISGILDKCVTGRGGQQQERKRIQGFSKAI